MAKRTSFFLTTEIEVHAKELVDRGKAKNLSEALRILFENGLESTKVHQRLEQMESKLDNISSLLQDLLLLVCKQDVILSDSTSSNKDEWNGKTKQLFDNIMARHSR